MSVHWTAYWKLPFWALQLGTGAKSFRANPLIASAALNRRGLHRARFRLADDLARRRRARLARLLTPEQRDAFARDGFLVIEKLLPDDDFKRLRDEVLERAFPAREMRQGGTVTRRTALDDVLRAGAPATAALAANPAFQGPMRYVGSFDAAPVAFVQTILADPERTRDDPQTALHSDTFHVTMKAWYALHDVGAEDGPFAYVPGSHRATVERLTWEFEQSLTAAEHPVAYHGRGSFRITEEELARFGFAKPRKVLIPANTLVVADTHGFHGRSISTKKTIRTEIYATQRRNPFQPWTGFDFLSLPGLKQHKVGLHMALRDLEQRLGGRGNAWRDVGAVKPRDPARI